MQTLLARKKSLDRDFHFSSFFLPVFEVIEEGGYNDLLLLSDDADLDD